MSLLIPADVAADLERDAWAERVSEHARVFNPMLKAVDERLSLVYVKESCQASGLRPGRFHVRLRNERGADLYMPVETEDGGFREPASDIIYRLQRCDLQNPAVHREFRAAHERREEDARRDEARRREARVEELAGRLKAYDVPAVSFQNVGGGWSYRVNRGADRRRREGTSS